MTQNGPNPAKQGRWYEDGLPFACTACGNCCKSNGEYSHVYLREEEVAAIADHLGRDRIEFLREELVVEDGWITLRPDLPECQFLTPEGRCGIYAVRPIQCRTWPFWDVNLEESTWREEVNGICPGSRGSGSANEPDAERGPEGGAPRPRIHSADQVDRIARATEDWYQDRLEEWPGAEYEL